MDTRFSAHARVTLTIEVDITGGGNYGNGWKIEDIYRDAERMALSHVQAAAAKDRQITIIGTPAVVAVITRYGSK